MLKRSFAPVADARTRILVLGSLPGDRSLAEQRYYAHPQNQFWRLIGSVIDCDLVGVDYPDRLALLLAAGIGLWDVIAHAHRPGSTDAAIRDLASNDLAALTHRLPALRAIGFNGGKSLVIGTRALVGTVPEVARLALPSSSPLHTIGIDAKLPAWLALRGFL
ncbi:MAG: DNA-deoxyinosine glycosylase [Pseudomonadota bacterium]|nr:DNA-deoxyinosine glycosylase [Pseudomonadota bacterium]